MAGKPIEVPTAAVTQTAQSVAASIAHAARPGPVPRPGAGTAIDAAAAAASSAVIKNVAASSAELAPKSAEVVAKADSAVAQFKETDAQEAARLKEVPANMQELPPSGRGAGVQALAGAGPDDWFEATTGLCRAQHRGGTRPERDPGQRGTC